MPTADRRKTKGWLGIPLWASLTVHGAGVAALALVFAAPLLLRPAPLIVDLTGPRGQTVKARASGHSTLPTRTRRVPTEQEQVRETREKEIAPAESAAGIAPATVHGAQVLFSPSPHLPESLVGEEMKATVLIEFTILSDGSATARLAQSSGNSKLDEIALRTASEWRFGPAAGERGPIDSRLRLRINFEVE